MFINDKEQKIKTTIEEITGIKPEIKQVINYDLIKDYRSFKIKKILLLSSSFDYFLLEEEGRLSSLLGEYCSYNTKEKPPEITHIETGKECLKILDKEDFDILIVFNKPHDTTINELQTKIQKISDIPIVLLGNNLTELSKYKRETTKSNIKNIFTWNGDGKIIISIIKNFEDSKNIEYFPQSEERKCVLLIEDSIQHYSTCLSIIYEEICNFLNDILNPSLRYEQRSLRYMRRPFVLHAKNFEEGQSFYEKYKNNLICMITDNYLGEGRNKKPVGVELANKAAVEIPDLPVLIQSSELIDESKLKSKKTLFISKNSPDLVNKLKIFIKKSLGSREFILKDNNGKKISGVKNLKDFEEALSSIDKTLIFRCAKTNKISKWLNTIGEVELSSKCFSLENESGDCENFCQRLIEILEDYKYSVNQASISSFNRGISESNMNISRIGTGALGGKARGISFLAKILSKYVSSDMFSGLRITIPRSIVLSTDVFDVFMSHNNLTNMDFYHLSDERIAAKFLDASLPATILGDLRAFIRNTRKPLIVRSSGLLEDSLMQPFAGIYSSMLLPNDSWETDIRFQEVCNAIKYVYASTYFEKARTYIKSTPKNISDEKMAVLLQEVVGIKHDNLFYPTISGVAKSYNYYPQGSCKPEDGIAYLALGLGKSIVDGGSNYAFCPERPKSPLFGTQKLYMKYSQTNFYALNLKSIYRIVGYNEETTLEKHDITVARQHGVLDKIASTYFISDDNFYPGIYDEGAVVIDFAPIINYDALPLAKALKLLLRVSEIALSYPVEIEFAVNIDKDEAELVILQIRSMLPPGKHVDINIDDIPRKEILFNSENALGNGTIEDIKEIVYVNQDTFDMSNSNKVVEQIRKINKKIMENNKQYILIGPGRWGSTDPWLGIPVIWSDIAGAKVIVETPYRERPIDPSQGSHFFHDMMASQVGYLITKKEQDINLRWLNSLKVVEETDFVKHFNSSFPLQVIIDGKKGKAIIRKKPNRENR